MQNNNVKEIPFSFVEAFGSANQTLVESLVAFQRRNLKYNQSIFESTIELLKDQVASTRSLMEKQAYPQKGVSKQLMPLPGAFVGYVDLFSIPLAYYQQLLELLESIWQQGFGSLEQATENFEQVTRQAREQSQEVAQQIPPATHPSRK